MAVAIGLACAQPGPGERLFAQHTAPVHELRIVKQYPHDPGAFTQGLVYRDGFLYESTGLNGRSTLRKVALDTGHVVVQHKLDDSHFAEGLAEARGRLIQLTWRSNVAFVYDIATLGERGSFGYLGEGWGLSAHDGELVMSDGSDTLRFLDDETFVEKRRLRVTENGIPVRRINELEHVRGEIYANVWPTNRIARIAPRTGEVLGWLNLTPLSPRRTDPEAVPNGIAYDAAGDRVFVTGKLWPSVFHVEVIEN